MRTSSIVLLVLIVLAVLLWRRAGRSRRYERRLEHSTIERITGHGAAWELFDGRRWPDNTNPRI